MDLLTFTTLLFIILKLEKNSAIVVKTSNGYVSGLEFKDYNNNSYYAFQSIPFAKPPIGNLRFQPPIEPDSWSGIRDGTQESPICPQPIGLNYIGQEDCLYLNVYTNALALHYLQSVVLYIHAGGFFRASGIFSNANPKLLITENIVIVTTNYRLSAFGFLTLNDSSILQPNNGFRDQVMVLKWIRKNIKYFGGNPYSVTISGVSAGGLSAHYHLYSPLSRGLFHRIISRSNTALVPLQPLQMNTAIELAEHLGINSNNLTQMVEALRNASVQDIFKAQGEFRWYDFRLDTSMYCGLCIEQPSPNSFISDSLLVQTTTGNYTRIPMMLSSTDQEGMIFNSTVVPNLFEITNISLHIPELFGSNRSLVEKEVMNYYFSGNFKYPYYEFWGDIWFKYGAYRTLEIASKYQRIYMANFALDSKLNVFKLTHSTIANVQGACHTDDDTYIFNKLLSPEIIPASLEEIWMKRMIRMQANFIKYANPTPFYDPLLLYLKWKPYHANKTNVLNLNNSHLTLVREYNKNHVFWDRMYDTYGPNFW